VLRWGSLRQWLLLGAALGLAGLAKYTAVTLVVTVVGALLLAGRARDLRGPGPWLAAALALLLVAPVLLWNAQHQWMSIRYQLRHGTGGSGWAPGDFLLSRAGELVTYGPALVLGGLLAAWQALRHERADPGVRLCLLTALPVLVLFWPASGREASLPHWTQLAWAALAGLAARWFVRGWHSRARRTLALAGAGWCGVLLLTLYLVLGARLGPADPVGRARAPFTGWDRAAATAVRLRDALPAGPGAPPVLFTNRWTSASRLAWYGRPAPVQVIDKRNDQFDLWFGAPVAGARGILVAWSDGKLPQPDEDLAHFARHTLVEEQPVEEPDGRIATFRFWACDDYQP
jgi:4-amino-4-deoxy-L-arabinose transferase-like glycosyltransferase